MIIGIFGGMTFYSIHEIAKRIGKSERTVYRLLLKQSISKKDYRIEGKVKLYSERVLNLLYKEEDKPTTDTSVNSNNELDSLRREIETLKFANEQLSNYTQKAFDSLKEEQKHVQQLTESLKASQSLQLLSEQRVQQLEEHIKLLDTPKKKKKKNKFKRQ